MSLVFAYLAGLLTLLNPCVLPVLPIVLASAVAAGPAGPVALMGGMAVSFTALGVAVSALGPALGLDPDGVARAAALVMALFGAALLLPRAGALLATAAGPLSRQADAAIPSAGPGVGSAGGQLVAGLLLGAVWSPCIGPTLGGALALAATGQDLGRAAAVMLAFSAGTATVMLALAFGLRALLPGGIAGLRRVGAAARPVLGLAFVAVGLALFFDLHHLAEGWALTHLPPWLTDLSVRY